MARIAICLAHNYDQFEKGFLLSLFRMQATFYEWVIKNRREDTLSIIIESGYRLDDMRSRVVQRAIKNHTHLLLLDTDQTFVDNTIPLMIEDFEDNPEAEIISGIYTSKTPPFVPQVYVKFNKNKKFDKACAFPLDRLFKVEGVATGIIMVKSDVFKRMKQPFFKFVNKGDKEFPNGIGEDLYFSVKSKAIMYCDPRINSLHLQKVYRGVDDYIRFNHLKIKDNQIVVNKEQVEKMVSIQKKA